MTAARLGVVIVNYKRADDTIECLESLLRSTVPLRVVVVDNDSGDGSATRIAAWAAGDLAPPVASEAMASLSQPPLPKPLALARSAGTAATSAPPTAALTLIEAGGNLGFAGGNNIGLRHLAQDPALEAFWLLNNDTVVAPDAAAALLTEMAAAADIGMCGTVVRYYWRPGVVQALGGSVFSRWTGNSHSIGGGQAAGAAFDKAAVIAATDFVLGASLAVSRRFLEAIGLMEESYFLYFEEIDWSARNRRHAPPFRIGFADKALVWHKEGGSIGSSGVAGKRSALSDYWLTRSRLAYVRRHDPLLLPLHALLTLGVAGRRLLRRQPDKAAAVIRALAGLQY
jgi:GT2 family glycosyltransferase